jgi:predicted secreted hydrolase
VRRRAFLWLPLAAALRPAFAQGHFPVVVAGTPLVFPRDHGSHPAFRTEWWYITGVARDATGSELGLQVTFFRSRPNVAEDNPSAFAPRQIVFAHAAVAEVRRGHLLHDQRVARAVFDLAGAAEETARVWLGDWTLALDGDVYRTRVEGRQFAFDLAFRPTQPPLLQGAGGVSRKGPRPEQASFYYSLPHLAVTGRVVVEGRAREVEGKAWLDHEWSSEYMAEGAVGWDWIGINLDDGGALMAFRMRDKRGAALWAGGSHRTAAGALTVFDPGQVLFEPERWWRSPRTAIDYPVQFAVRAGGFDYRVVPWLDDAELDSRTSTGTIYWEGPVEARAGARRAGRGYLELTGYGGTLRI